MGLLAASAKKGSPIETKNKPMSQNAVPWAGGSPQLAAIDKGSVSPAVISSTTWTATATGGCTARIRICA